MADNQYPHEEEDEDVHGTPGSNTDSSPTMALLIGQLDRFQVDVFCKAAQKQGVKRTMSIFSKKKGPATDKYTVEDMLTFSKDIIPTSLLKLSNDHASRGVKIFSLILKYMGESGEPVSPQEGVTICNKLLREGLKRPELRDELYAQLSKQTRNNPNLRSNLKAWELMHLVAATMPPSKDFVSYVSEYIHDCAHDPQQPPEVKSVALKAWSSLKRCAKAGPRRTVPTPEEIEALCSGRTLNTIVFFLDETFEELLYDITTTVLEAVERLASIIKLQNYHTFSLFECRKYVMPKGLMPGETTPDEHIFLDDHKYVADVLADFRTLKGQGTKEAVQSKLLFKKRMFRETDESITEAMFINLSYVQAQHDYLQGNYPVGRDDAAQLAALQMQAEMDSVLKEPPEALSACVEKYITKQVLLTRPHADWVADVQQRYKALEQFSKEDARMQVLRILRSLPYGNSIFFVVKRIEDPIGLLPGRIILGINKRGIHFFRPVPKEYLHSAELRDIMQFGSSHSAVFFKMRVAGVLHIFQFETKQGEDICVALQTHINDVMMRRYSKAKAVASDPASGAASNFKGEGAPGTMSFGHVYEKRVADMSKVLDEKDARIAEMTAEKAAMQAEIRRMEAELADTVDQLHTEEQQKGQVDSMQDTLAKELADTKTKLLEAEVQMAKLISDNKGATGKPSADQTAKVTSLQQKLEEQTKELNAVTEKQRSCDKVNKQLTKDKQLLENKVGRLEKSNVEAATSMQQKMDEEIGSLKKKIESTEKETLDLTEQLASTRSLLEEREAELNQFQQEQTELEELRELKKDMDRKDAQTSAIIKRQAEQIEQLENLYREEQILRKKYFNMMEDMKGKIRVFCRTRPLSVKDQNQGSSFAVSLPDEFTIEHPWKEEKKPRSYQFDACFPALTTQDAVFEDTRYLVQSAVDGYNVCIFAYGQTGSGKTHTINGSGENPGLTPRAVKELFKVVQRDSNKFSFSITCYMVELYQDNLSDLLVNKDADRPKLEIKKDAKGWVTVQNVQIEHVNSWQELQGCIDKGLRKRRTAGTQMNVESSRSHLIVTAVIESTNLQTQSLVKGKLSFVDLAGSERIKKSGSTGNQLKEAQAINKSLSALGDVISALATEQPHIPYRNHKLTMLMSDSLGGNAKTLMFVNVSPSSDDLEETQNSLSYATRVRTIINDASKNVTTKEMVRLQKQLAHWKAKAGAGAGEELLDIEDEKWSQNADR
uniref:Kinesin-like protein n=1 Tax=Pyramimonas obovata TaxID=1411642 RepID=A0A7S0R8D5_9CHLO|mmetsp:Transcript_27555/g.60182  ORF Transcript_27555/g.60182 Transcript_27555/m.60182 type:complete len:1226 (+) Transcript_27555:157-3834(+)